jgi:hypothetical protein
MRLAEGDVRRVRTKYGEEIDAVWDDRRYFKPCDDEGTATSDDGLDVVAVMVPEPTPRKSGANIPEWQRNTSALKLRVLPETIAQLDALCGATWTRSDFVAALVDSETSRKKRSKPRAAK